MAIAGIPLHPLVVHVAVVFGPLAAFLAILFAAVPGWRWALRWPLAFTLMAAVIGAALATTSGDALVAARPGLGALEVVQAHQQRGETARNVVVALAFFGSLAIWRLPGSSPLRPFDPPRTDGPLEHVIAGGAVLASIAVLVAVFLAGHSGATAVWG